MPRMLLRISRPRARASRIIGSRWSAGIFSQAAFETTVAPTSGAHLTSLM